MSRAEPAAPEPPATEPPTTEPPAGAVREPAVDLAGYLRDVPDFPTPGVLFKDITPMLADPRAFASAVRRLAAAAPGRIDAVVGIEARGFILGAPVAVQLGAGFVPVRKAGKLPGRVREVGYDLEYGHAVLAMHSDGLRAGQRVLVIDDVLATGGTAAAAVGLVRELGAEPVALAVLLELTALGGRARVDLASVHALITL